MLRKFSIGLLLILIASIFLWSAQVSAGIIEQMIIYKEFGVYACFPSLFKAEDGTLVISFGTRTSNSHFDSAGGTKTLVSRDEGKTWTKADRIYYNPAFKDRAGHLVIPYIIGWREVSDTPRHGFKKPGDHGDA